MVDRKLFKKAERKIAKARTPSEHRRIESHGGVTSRGEDGRTYRLRWTIREIRRPRR